MLLALIGLWALPKPDVILSISAQSEVLEYQVTDSNAASIAMSNVLLISNNDPFDTERVVKTCLTGRLLPQSGMTIRYRRGRNGSIGISFTPVNPDLHAGSFEIDGGATIKLTAISQFLLDPEYEPCPGVLPATLPVWGTGSIGMLRTFGSGLEIEPGDLISGQVRVTAKAVERIFGVLKGARGLYDAGVVTLPAGSRLASVNEWGNNNGANPLPWIGAARVLDKNGISAFQVDVSTDSDTVWLYRSAQGRNEGRPDPIGAAAFVSQTRDPGIIRIQVVLAIVLIIIQTVATVMQTVLPSRNPAKPKPARTKKTASAKKSKKKKNA